MLHHFQSQEWRPSRGWTNPISGGAGVIGLDMLMSLQQLRSRASKRTFAIHFFPRQFDSALASSLTGLMHPISDRGQEQQSGYAEHHLHDCLLNVRLDANYKLASVPP